MLASKNTISSILKRSQVLAMSASLLLLQACQAPTPPVQQTFYVFGTEVTIHIYDTELKQAQAAIHAIEQEFLAMHQAWHAWEPHGWVYQINQAINQQHPIEIPQDIANFIQQSQQLSAKTNYLFDPGIGSLIALWGFHKRDWRGPPPDQALRKAWLKQRPSIGDLQLIDRQLISQNPDVRLDFGGNLKGLAVQRAWSILKAHEIPRALINLGGDLGSYTADASDTTPWTIKIRDPQHPEQALVDLDLPPNLALFTSGTYQRYFDWQGKRFSHILNPNTAEPAQSFASVTIWHPDPIIADTLATAILIAGPEQWQSLVNEFELTHYLFVDQQNQQIISPAIAAVLRH